jgi:hypothetical protein
MTTGNVLYLLMSTGAFVVFSAVLAYQSWQQSRVGPEVVATQARRQDAHNAVAA